MHSEVIRPAKTYYGLEHIRQRLQLCYVVLYYITNTVCKTEIQLTSHNNPIITSPLTLA